METIKIFEGYKAKRSEVLDIERARSLWDFNFSNREEAEANDFHSWYNEEVTVGGGDATHCSVTDFYSDHLKELTNYLNGNKSFTTGWYSTKKELHSGKIDGYVGDKIVCQVEVNNDFDIVGMGTCEIPWTASTSMDDVCDALEKALQDADASQKEYMNEHICMYKLIKKDKWLETYIVADDYFYNDYYTVGFQGDHKISKATKKEIEDAIRSGNYSEPIKGWTIEKCED